MKKSFLVLSLATCMFAKDIVFTYVKSPLNVPSIVEKHKAIFAKHFAPDTVKYSELTAGPKQTSALASGDIDFLFAVGATSVFLAASNGLDIGIINAYSRAPEAYNLISKQKLDTIKGKKIAGPKGTILHELLLAYLKKEGLSIKDVEYYPMDIPAAAAALASGKIDVAMLAGPHAYTNLKNGYHKVCDGNGLILPLVVNASKKDIDKELLKKFKLAQEEILNTMKNDEKQSLEYAMIETKLDEQSVKDMYVMYDFSSQITQEDIKSMQKTIDFMYENQMIKNKLDPKELIIK